MKQPPDPPAPNENLFGTQEFTDQLVVVRDRAIEMRDWDIRRTMRYLYRVSLYQTTLFVYLSFSAFEGWGFDEPWSIVNSFILCACIPWLQVGKRRVTRKFYLRAYLWIRHVEFWEQAVAAHRTEVMRRKWRES